MNEGPETKVSRRDFAQRVMMLSAAAPLASAVAVLEAPGMSAAAGQAPANLPKLSSAGQAEADARFQHVLSLHANQFDDTQKEMVKTLCTFLQPALDRVRSFPLDNGDISALNLKPLVEREKKPKSVPPAAASPEHS